MFLPTVMIFGTFDTVHEGHKDFIRQAAALGNLIIVVARDVNVLKFKKKLVHDEEARLKNVRKQFPQAKVIPGYRDDPHEVIRKFLPDIICLGYDQRSFERDLETKFPAIQVIRLKPFQPETYKSSKLLP